MAKDSYHVWCGKGDPFIICVWDNITEVGLFSIDLFTDFTSVVAQCFRIRCASQLELASVSFTVKLLFHLVFLWGTVSLAFAIILPYNI